MPLLAMKIHPKDNVFLLLVFFSSLCLVQPLTEVLSGVNGRKSHPLQQEQSLSLSYAAVQIYHKKAL